MGGVIKGMWGVLFLKAIHVTQNRRFREKAAQHFRSKNSVAVIEGFFFSFLGQENKSWWDVNLQESRSWLKGKATPKDRKRGCEAKHRIKRRVC